MNIYDEITELEERLKALKVKRASELVYNVGCNTYMVLCI